MTHLHSLHFAKRLRRLINNTLKVFISETKNTPCTNINSAGVFCFTCTRRSPSPAAGAARGALALVGHLHLRSAYACGALALAGYLCLRDVCACGTFALAGHLCLRGVCTCGALVLAGRLHLRGACACGAFALVGRLHFLGKCIFTRNSSKNDPIFVYF